MVHAQNGAYRINDLIRIVEPARAITQYMYMAGFSVAYGYNTVIYK